MKRPFPMTAPARAWRLLLVFSVAALFGMTPFAFAQEEFDGDAPDVNYFPGQTPVPLFGSGSNAGSATANVAPRQRTIRRARSARRTARRESAPSGQPPEGEVRIFPDQVIVRYRLSARQSRMDALVRRFNLRHLEGRTFVLAGVTVHRYSITDGTSVREIIAALEADSTVVSAQPNYIYALMQTAGAAAQAPQYALDRLDVAGAHALATGDGVVVAVIDSQIDTDHAEFSNAAIKTLDATGLAAGDADAHGTSIAGVIASHGTLTGIAPDVRLIGIRAFAPNDEGAVRSTTWTVATALDEASEAHAQIVNMSFAGPQDPLVEASVAGSIEQGMVDVAAAGNDGPDAPPLYPAAYPGVIAVTATDKDDLIYDHANRGDYIALSAPGVDILTPSPGNSYASGSGTSLAAAHISGLAALVLSHAPSISGEKVAEILESSSSDLGDPGRDAVFGAGLPDALVAVNAGAENLSN